METRKDSTARYITGISCSSTTPAYLAQSTSRDPIRSCEVDRVTASVPDSDKDESGDGS